MNLTPHKVSLVTKVTLLLYWACQLQHASFNCNAAAVSCMLTELTEKKNGFRNLALYFDRWKIVLQALKLHSS